MWSGFNVVGDDPSGGSSFWEPDATASDNMWEKTVLYDLYAKPDQPLITIDLLITELVPYYLANPEAPPNDGDGQSAYIQWKLEELWHVLTFVQQKPVELEKFKSARALFEWAGKDEKVKALDGIIATLPWTPSEL